MSESTPHNYRPATSKPEFNRLPSRQRKSAALHKYAKAVTMYASTSLSIKQIAAESGVTASGLSAHIARHHRPLLLARYGIEFTDPSLESMPVRPHKGQSQKNTH